MHSFSFTGINTSLITLGCARDEKNHFDPHQTMIVSGKSIGSNVAKSENDFQFEFTLDERKPTEVEGMMLLDGENVNVAIDITNGLNVSDYTKIDENTIEFYNNGELLRYSIIDSNENSTTMRFSTPTTSKDFLFNAGFTFDDLTEEPPFTTPAISMACPPCVVVVAVVVIGGAYCAWKHESAAKNCKSAYDSCTKGHGKCQYKFTSSSCGGSCSINPI